MRMLVNTRALSRVLIVAACATPLTTQAQENLAATSGPAPRFRLLVNGAYHASTKRFTDAATFTEFLEQRSSSRNYDGGTGLVFEVGGIYSITSSFGVMGSIELFDGDNDAAFREIVPHPLFFDQDRSVEGSVSSLSYSEKALHLDAVYTRKASSFTVDLYGGPSFFLTQTELITEIISISGYPFDELTLGETSVAKFQESSLGFNVGGALTFRLSRLFGIGIQARYSRATVSLKRDGAEAIDFSAGGFRAGGGIRLAF
jgi:hypothetical protein